jgi:solute carrier family 13 (sodium-dependent dicarboxylate transporter), member 2/3/5
MAEKAKATGYDKYVNWKLLIIPVVLFFLILALPAPKSMQKVGIQYEVGKPVVVAMLTEQLFHVSPSDVEQWQLVAANMMEQNMRMGALKKARFLKRDFKWAKKYKITSDKKNFERAFTWVKENLNEEQYGQLLQKAFDLRMKELNYEGLSDSQKKSADNGTWKIKVAIAMMVFVVFCFMTECMPLPGVAFMVGMILVFSGVVKTGTITGMYWSDAAWFIMGSLMFAAAFVKTGVDKRLCMMMFKKLATPNVKWITLIFFLIITPLAAFISDHALAAMFLPIGMLLYQNSLTDEIPEDKELAKMLMIAIAMACNIGGPGAPSGGARNVIMIAYLNDMFGFDIGYFQWVTYCFPFILVMIPVTWIACNMLFKPKIKSLAPAMAHLEREIGKMGKWNSKQIWALAIFAVMVFGWFTEKAFYSMGIYPVRLGIGTIAVAGAMAYLLAGIVNWRDYQERVDWGVVWLYAGAICFGRVLDESGAAFWLARSVVDALAPFGMDSGLPLMLTSNGLTAIITNLMADGPAAAAVGPITLNMAGLVHPGTTYLPFMAMGTAIASSFAYCLIIGTPPNAIVYASGYLEPKDYLRVGVPLWVVANIVLILVTAVYWGIRGFGGLPGF